MVSGQKRHGSAMHISDVTELVILNDAIMDDINVFSIDNCVFEPNLA